MVAAVAPESKTAWRGLLATAPPWGLFRSLRLALQASHRVSTPQRSSCKFLFCVEVSVLLVLAGPLGLWPRTVTLTWSSLSLISLPVISHPFAFIGPLRVPSQQALGSIFWFPG